ncbi:MAG: DNA photolyase [Desulfobacteraceae bacterium]|nr:DNA photolyase [Desulfobacteraceae bacterium]MBC2756515.1 DNA photolyase [Desulfobacteraceae bacterium]
MKITDLYIDKEVLDYPATNVICDRLNTSFQVVNNAEDVYGIFANVKTPVEKGKKTLFLTKNKGKFIRQCPGTDYYTCCNYMILHFGIFCTMDCSYCILQSYFHPPLLQFFVNHKDLEKSLDHLFLQKKLTRIGTGEYTDSLIWEEIYPFAEMLVSKFSRQSHAILELKTKTVNIENLLSLRHNRKTVVSWSLNTERVVKSEERQTASIKARLTAAVKCQEMGYPLAFHFDPLIIYPGCEEDYKKIIKQLFANILPENIVWISLGSFRFMPALKSIIEQRFDQSKIVYGEFIKGIDGKMRYFKPLRINFYRQIVSYIREIAPNVTVYFCMEDDEVWLKTLGFTPSEYGGLPMMLDKSASRHCDVF